MLGPGTGTEIAEVLCDGQGGSRLPPAALRVNGELVWVQQSGADWPVGNSKVLVVQHQGPKTSFCANTMSRGRVTGQISSGSSAPGSQTLPAPPRRGSRIIRPLGQDRMSALWGLHGAAGIPAPPQLPCFLSQAVLAAPSPPGPCLSCKPLIQAVTCCSHPPALSLHPLSLALFLLCYPGLFLPCRLRAAGSC